MYRNPAACWQSICATPFSSKGPLLDFYLHHDGLSTFHDRFVLCFIKAAHGSRITVEHEHDASTRLQGTGQRNLDFLVGTSFDHHEPDDFPSLAIFGPM